LIASRALPRAIVFNCHITGLAVARSLAAHGVEVIALDPDPRGLGQASRSVVQRHKCPNPLEDERGFVEYLLDNAKRFGDGAVLFPTNDEWVMAVARYRSQLEACYRIPFSELGVIDAVGQEAIVVSVETRPQSVSLWCVFDNTRLAALSALWIAETLALSSPTLA